MRMTRAALRAQTSHESLAIHEDTDTSQELRIDQEDAARPVLKDITEENTVPAGEDPAPPKKTRGRKKGKASEDGAAEAMVLEHQERAEPPEDAETSSCAPEIAANTATLEQAESQGLDVQSETTGPATPTVSDANSDSVPEELQLPEIAEPLNQTHAQQVAISKTPKFIPDIHGSATITMDQDHDSFVDSIKSRSPGKLSAEPSEHEDDPIMEKISSRSPRPASRIEDTVEAMDALEDALEQFSGEIPVLDSLRIESPIKDQVDTPSKTLPPSARKTATNPTSLSKSVSPARNSPGKSPSRSTAKPKVGPAPVKRAPLNTTSGRVAGVKPSVGAPTTKKSTNRPITAAAKSLSKDTQPGMSFSNSPLKTQPAAIKKRVPSDTLSTSRPGFVPAKSTKAVTKSTFTLPGEVYSAKMKAQREEKAKKEAEEEAARRQFKARPAPSGASRPSVLPRENKASQARLSRVFSGTDKENVEPKPAAPSKRPTSMLLDVKKVRTEANSAIRRTASVTSKSSSAASREPKFAANVPRVASLTSKPAAPKEEPAAPTTYKKVSGKEVFGRTKIEIKKQEDEKREKEEAARKARAEAAEKGRQASREWAEKQKAKLAAQKAALAAKQETATAA